MEWHLAVVLVAVIMGTVDAFMMSCPDGEVYNTCGSACPTTCADVTSTLYFKPCVKKCVCGCFCKSGLVRQNADGTGPCVHPQQCFKSITACTIAHEECSPCGCEMKCTMSGGIRPSCPVVCKQACACKRGYARFGDRCIPANSCPRGVSGRSCDGGEIFLNCGKPCPTTCFNYDSTDSCWRRCSRGCFCRKGLVRQFEDGTGPCIPLDKCHACPAHELYLPAGRPCDRTCNDFRTFSMRKDLCDAGCYCEEGYVRELPNGQCIPKEMCPVACPAYEKYMSCGTACETTCENQNSMQICSLNCVPGCFCEEGYVRKTPGACPAHEKYRSCGTACETTCENQFILVLCSRRCVPGCFCESGYVRKTTGGPCIPQELCPKTCPANEKYMDCGTSCEKTCENQNSLLMCTMMCVPGCFCEEGYVRKTSHGPCILKEQCPQSCPANEKYTDCGTSWEETCDNQTSLTRCTMMCVPGCFCDKGYVRKTPGGPCILKEQCPKTCPAHEKYTDCGTACEKTCKNKDAMVKCTSNCVAGCFCEEGYVRKTSGGPCILKEQCPQTCPEHEKYTDCGTACEESCDNQNTLVRCRNNCVAGCFCEEGYIRKTRGGPCILKELCPKTCPANEKYTDCGTACEETCEIQNPVMTCLMMCVPGCFCEEGYVRETPGGPCILRELCPTCPVNEKYRSCGTACEKTCDDHDLVVSCTKNCVQGCFCEEGYVRKVPRGMCIPVEQCPKICPPYEKYSDCGTMCERTCDNYKKSMMCPAMCVRGCFCEEGYVRHTSNGTCIPQELCSTNCPSDQEVYKDCSCDRTCEDVVLNTPCKDPCLDGCFCKEGFVREFSNGPCIPVKDCPGICPPYERYVTCGKVCEATCENLHSKQVCTLQCKDGCICEEGYVREFTNGPCIPKDQCVPSCPSDKEEYKKCGCEITCDDVASKTSCKDPCVDGCFCKEGFVRETTDGPCIPEEECPRSCPSDKEEYKKCGCEITCDDVASNTSCKDPCVDGCFCKEGFVRETTDGPCIPEEECPRTACPTNEKYSEYDAGCQPTCQEMDAESECSPKCKPGCVCARGYIREYPDGPCIPKKQCRKRNRKPCPPHEKFTDCGPTCIVTCERPEPKPGCRQRCREGCFCDEGFIRQYAGGPCIPEGECTISQSCSVNEVFSKCGRICEASCDSARPNSDECKPDCACRRGLVRKLPEDICIPKRECVSE